MSKVWHPNEPLGLATECDAWLDFWSAFLSDTTDEGRVRSERTHRKPAQKIKMVNQWFAEARPDVAGGEPYGSLPARLQALYDYRDTVVHSYPDHGNEYRRLRRRRGVNSVVELSQEQIAGAWENGLVCQSALFAIQHYLPPVGEGAARR